MLFLGILEIEQIPDWYDRKIGKSFPRYSHPVLSKPLPCRDLGTFSGKI